MTQAYKECVTSGESVPSLWEQTAISPRVCETSLSRLSRLDGGGDVEMFGGQEDGGLELWAPFVPASLTPIHKHKHWSHCRPVPCQHAGCMPTAQRASVWLRWHLFMCVWEGALFISRKVEGGGVLLFVSSITISPDKSLCNMPPYEVKWQLLNTPLA